MDKTENLMRILKTGQSLIYLGDQLCNFILKVSLKEWDREGSW